MNHRKSKPNPKPGQKRELVGHIRTGRTRLSSATFLIVFVLAMFANRTAAIGQDTSLSSKLSSAAPETCLTWFQWSNPYRADANSENGIDRMMAEPEVNKFCKDFTDKLGQLPAILVPVDAPVEIKNAAEVLGPQLVDALFRKQGCLFVESIELEEGQEPKNLKIGLVLEVGDDVTESIKSVEALLKMADVPMESVDLGGQNGIKIALPPGGPFNQVTLAQQDGYLIAGTGETVREIAKRIKAGQVVDWLSKFQAEQKYVRSSAVGMIDVAAIRKQFLPLLDEQTMKVVSVLGLDNLDRVEFSGGYARTDFAQRVKLKFDGTPGGIFATIDGKGLTTEDIAHFPDDSFFAVAMSVDSKKMLEEFTNILIQLEPNAAREMAGGFIQFQSETGVDLKKLIGNFGPNITLHNGYGDGLLTGVQLRTALEDPKWFEKTVDDLLAFGVRELGMPAKEHSFEQNGKTIKSLHFMGEFVPVEPSWFVDGNQVTLSLFPSVLGTATNPELAPPLIKHPSFAPYLGLFEQSANDGKTIGFSYIDSSWAYQMMYGYACMGGAMAKNGEWGEFGLPLPAGQIEMLKAHLLELQLPSFRSVSKYLTPDVAIIRREEDAIVIESHSMMANSNLTVALPAIAVGLLLPAIQQTRSAARRVTSMNNLRMFALATHNYESAHMKFPSGDGPVRPDGPAVSWRVKILPFIEAANLYEMYNFDEPWDSENNLKVAKEMPPVFRNPASNAPEGYTVYRGVGGTSGVMGIGADEKSVGRRLRDIVDGTSNTILFVEVPDEMAVPWTKPDGGIDPDETGPWDLLGNFPGGFNVALCDGSVRFVDVYIDAETFENLLKFDDGNVVEWDDF